MILNNRFRLDSDRNLLTDLATHASHKLEPRVMKVMLYLAAHAGQVVTRDELVEKLWDNYGGAEDALTQAISTLRKVCGDESKTLIRTVPKKGYVLDTSVTAATTPEITASSPVATSPARRFLPVYILVALVVLTLLLFRRFGADRVEKQQQQAEPQADSATIQREKAEQKGAAFESVR